MLVELDQVRETCLFHHCLDASIPLRRQHGDGGSMALAVYPDPRILDEPPGLELVDARQQVVHLAPRQLDLSSRASTAPEVGDECHIAHVA